MNGTSAAYAAPRALVPAAALEGEAPVEEYFCCYGAAGMGRDRCTCWEPVYDLEQQPLENGGVPPAEPATRRKCCADCAYRNGSPERERGEELPRGPDKEFWCHQGMRRAVAYRHPESGREVPAGDGDYQPPVGPRSRPFAWRADGTPGERCAGWAAMEGIR